MPTFDVYPQPQTAPVNIGAGASVVTPLITERRSSDPQPAMFIRVAMIGGVTAPTLKLQAGTGDPVTVPSASGIWDLPGGPGNGNYVADSFLIGPTNGVLLIKVLVYLQGLSSWKLTITNNDASPRDFTFVVASADGGADGGAKQPWMVADPAVVFSEVLVNDTGFLNLSLANKGTGDLTGVTGAFSGPDAASFTFTPPAAAIGPNSSGTGQVTLLAVAAPKQLSASLKLSSNDTTALAAPGHNNTAAVTGQVEQLEVALMLDASGSMALDPDGKQTKITIDPNATRYGILKTAVEAALTALKNHASGKGFFGVGMYPDITGFPALPSSPYGGPFPVASPSAADFQANKPISDANAAAATTALEQHFTRINGAATPMGAGIQHAIGDSTGALPWGYFLTDDTSKNTNRRWLFLMTDGNQNSGQDPSAFYGGAGSFVAKKIQVGAIGYGSETAVAEPVNKTLLQAIAQHGYLADNTNFHFTLATGMPNEVSMFIKPLLYNGLKFDSGADPGGVLTSASPVVTRQISVTPYDDQLSFFVAWNTFNPARLRVQVRTPLGELIEQAGHEFTVDTNPRFRMLTFRRDFLANAKDPANARYGVWTLIITLVSDVVIGAPTAAAQSSENYNYDVFLSSRLKLRTELNQTSYAPGESIQVSARLTLDGTGIPNATVTLSRLLPGAAHGNFLARSVLSSQEYNQVAAAQKANPDIDSTGIKLLGLANKGLTFDLSPTADVLNMADADDKGVYVATTANTSVPGTYQFQVSAVGSLPDGTFFRRERSLDIQVAVRPEPNFTLFHVDYSVVVRDGVKFTRAVLTASPQDRFGNVVFIDPSVDPSILFTTTAGRFTGGIVDNHDGSYSQTLEYGPTDHPGVGVIVGGTIAVPTTPVASVPSLHFIDAVFQFTIGREAVPGANKHTVASACLGDFTAKSTPEFVSLGGGGSIVVGLKDHVMVGSGGNEDVTVFIAPDEQPRPYLVEATEDDDRDDWFEIGRSAGVTQSFGLQHRHEHDHHAKVINARALRITDLSWKIRNNDGTPSPSPAVSVAAVGALKVGEAHTDILEAIENVFKKIF